MRTLQALSHDEFINVCVMGGCEYLNSIDRVGLKVVLKNLEKAKTCEQVVKDLKASKSFKDRVPQGYLETMKKVRQIFKYQTVYDPRSRKFVPLNQPEEKEPINDQDYVGAMIDSADMEDYANGKINKKTL